MRHRQLVASTAKTRWQVKVLALGILLGAGLLLWALSGDTMNGWVARRGTGGRLLWHGATPDGLPVCPHLRPPRPGSEGCQVVDALSRVEDVRRACSRVMTCL